jgi:tetratricopeptide (TPR) repeat protein
MRDSRHHLWMPILTGLIALAVASSPAVAQDAGKKKSAKKEKKEKKEGDEAKKAKPPEEAKEAPQEEKAKKDDLDKFLKEEKAAKKEEKAEKKDEKASKKEEKASKKEEKAAKKEEKAAKKEEKAEKKEEKAEKKEEKEAKKETKKAAKDDKKKAEELHGKAVELYKEGNYEEALKYFSMAHELAQNPVTLFNMGRCYEKLGKIKEAYDYYKQYIDSGDEGRRADAEEAIKNIEALPVKVTITVKPKDAEVFVDGEPVETDAAPVVVELTPGQHTIFARKDGYENVEEGIVVEAGEDEAWEGELIKAADTGETKKKHKAKRTGPIKVPLSIHLAAGATVSTSDIVTSYIGADIGLGYRIKQFTVGIGLDNMFFADSYLLAAFAAGSYTQPLPKKLSLNFTVGFGGAYLYSSQKVVDGSDVKIKSGGMGDIVVHADAKLRYEVGPVLLLFIPLSADIFVGAGNIEPAPLAQFAFLVGVGYDF